MDIAAFFAVKASFEPDFLHPLPATALFGLGPPAARRLTRLGIESLEDLGSHAESSLVAALGQHPDASSTG